MARAAQGNRAADRPCPVLREPGTAGIGQSVIIQAVAQSLGVELKPIELGEQIAQIERDISKFARSPNGGLITAVSGVSMLHRDLLITLATMVS
jgi:L-alanine-DL-glutamate epimerase-like enolase superfamily enzyme